MFRKKTVRELMVPIESYSVTSAAAKLAEAVPMLRKLYCTVEAGRCTEAGHRTILVMNASGQLVGILDFKSILRVLIPEIAGTLHQKFEALELSVVFAQSGIQELDEANLDFRSRVQKNAEVPVEAVMLKVRGTIEADASILDGLKMLYRNKLTVLPVTEKGKVVGVLRDSDLFLATADILME